MNIPKYLLMLLAFLGLSSVAMAEPNDPARQDGSHFDLELNERDISALREYLNTKRDIPLEEKDDNLSMSGDVHFEYRYLKESLQGVYLRGKRAKNPWSMLPISNHDFDVEFNLKFDYIMDKTWCMAHIQYDNSAGVSSEDYFCYEDCEGWFGSGTVDKLTLKKAYMGYNLLDYCGHRIDIELGRRGNLYNVFDSRVQFLSRMDGLLLNWETSTEWFSEVYLKAAGFVVDERTVHLAYATEIGFMNILDSGIDFKYSFIDWHAGSHKGRCGFDRCEEQPICLVRGKFFNNPDAFKYQVSQFTLAYHFDEGLFCRPAKVYGAVLFNHMLHRCHLGYFNFPYKRQLFDEQGQPDGFENEYPGATWFEEKTRSNLGWYVGFLIGEVKKEGDWSLEVQYQEVGATAVPGQDMGGIGTGNALDLTLTRDAVDNTNFKGWRVDGLYALTDEITLQTTYETSRALKKRIGGQHKYSKVELEAIYAF